MLPTVKTEQDDEATVLVQTRHERIQTITVLYSIGKEIVDHISEAGCEGIMLKLVVDDLADKLQELATDPDGLDQRLSESEDEELEKWTQVLRGVSERVAKCIESIPVRDVKLKHVLLPALQRRLAHV